MALGVEKFWFNKRKLDGHIVESVCERVVKCKYDICGMSNLSTHMRCHLPMNTVGMS